MGITLGVFWFLLSFIVGIYADRLGRFGIGYFFISLLLSPLLVALLLLALGQRTVELTAKTHRHCPNCAEMVLNEATICKHCHSALTPVKPPQPPKFDDPMVGAVVIAACTVVWIIAQGTEGVFVFILGASVLWYIFLRALSQ